MPDIKQTCRLTGQKFIITEADQKFYEDVSPIINGKRYKIPLPTLHPTERKRQRLSFRNLRSLYKRTCDLSGKEIISCNSPDSPYPVYYSDEWWSDKWDPMKFGREFDFNKTFFEQFKTLLYEVPHIHNYVILSENCDYINGASNCRNCYLSFNMDYCEDCLYIQDAKKCVSCVDSYGMISCELCYDCLDCEKCYNLKYSTRSVSCSDSYFLSDCRQCKNCIGCVNLVGKEYYIFNKKATKEEYEKYVEGFKSRDYVQKFKKEFEKFSIQFPKKYFFGHSNEEFSGDNIQNIKNSFECYDSFNLENCKYCYYVFNSSNCMDYEIFGDNSEWIYNCLTTGFNCSNNICCIGTWNGSSNNMYCHLISGSSNNFGCSGIKQKKYCILNKQYTKEEYEKLVPKIIEHMKKHNEWGEFFPQSISPYGYNETMAQQFFPLTETEANSMQYTWKQEGSSEKSKCEKIVIPDHIDQTSDELIKKNLTCKKTGNQFRIITQEFKFYKKHGIPLPDVCPEERNLNRFNKRNPQKLIERTCHETGEKLQTTYPLESDYIVYSEKAYLDNLL